MSSSAQPGHADRTARRIRATTEFVVRGKNSLNRAALRGYRSGSGSAAAWVVTVGSFELLLLLTERAFNWLSSRGGVVVTPRAASLSPVTFLSPHDAGRPFSECGGSASRGRIRGAGASDAGD